MCMRRPTFRSLFVRTSCPIGGGGEATVVNWNVVFPPTLSPEAERSVAEMRTVWSRGPERAPSTCHTRTVPGPASTVVVPVGCVAAPEATTSRDVGVTVAGSTGCVNVTRITLVSDTEVAAFAGSDFDMKNAEDDPDPPPPPQAAASTLSILPDGLKKRKSFSRGGFWMVAAGVLTGALLLVLTGLAIWRKSAETSSLEEFRSKTADVRKRIDDMAATAAEQRDLVARTDYLQSYLGSGRALLE